MILEFGVALFLVVANGFFVATEFGLARVRPTQIAAFEAAGRPGAGSLRHAVDHLDAYLAACQLGITISSIGLGFIGKPAFEELIDPVAEPVGDATGIAAYGLSFFFAFALVTLLHVVFGELAPKSLAISRNTKTALAVAVPMRIFYIAMKPLVDSFNWMGNLVLRPFGIPPASEAAHAPHSEAELRELLRHSVQEGLLDASDLFYAENVFAFCDRRARQIMVPRPEIDFVTTAHTLRDAAECATRTGHTRLPLCKPDGGLDAAVGVVNAKDVLRAMLAGDDPPLADLVRPLERVSESMRVHELLTQLREDRRHVVLVVDEHGTTVGLVSLEARGDRGRDRGRIRPERRGGGAAVRAGRHPRRPGLCAAAPRRRAARARARGFARGDDRRARARAARTAAGTGGDRHRRRTHGRGRGRRRRTDHRAPLPGLWVEATETVSILPRTSVDDDPLSTRAPESGA